MASHFDNISCALVTGAAGGLGRAIAQNLISRNIKVILVGRTEASLAATTKEIGANGYYVLDVGDISQVHSFVQRVVKEHPEVDCIINNAGVQRPLNFLETEKDEFLQKADQEIDINIRGPMHLIMEFLPHLKSKKSGLIINVTSVLGFVPFVPLNPVYNATKSWLHFFTMNLRTQLKDTNIKVVEVAPPSVGTDLHRDREDPNDNDKAKNPKALTVDEWLEDFVQKMERGHEVIAAGMADDVVKSWYASMMEWYPN